MAEIELEIPEFREIKDLPNINESWLQEYLANNLELLDLGDLVVRDRERSQPGGGRLALLVVDVESGSRFEG